MSDVGEKNLEDLLSKEDLAEVKGCATEMDNAARAAGGQISVSAQERQPLGVKSHALLEHQKEQEKESGQGRG